MAMLFNQNGNERVLVPQQSQLDLTAAITACAWIKMTALSVGAHSTYMSKNDFYMLHYNYVFSATELSFQYVLGTAWRNMPDNVTPTLDVWFHSVGTYDKNAAGNNMIIYRNGVIANSARYTDTILTTSTGLSIGSLNQGRYLQGTLADCRLYNRALSAQEVLTLYSTRGHDGIRNGLVGRWMMNENYNGLPAGISTGVVKDTSIYKNHGNTLNDDS